LNFSSHPEGLKTTGQYLIEGLNLLGVSQALNDQVFVSGILNISGSFLLAREEKFFETTFVSVDKKGIKQTLNFGAVRALTALATGNPIRSIGKQDFHYLKLAGRVTIKNGYITIEGLAGKKGENSYLLKGPIWGQGINVLVHTKTNTIRLEDFRKRLARAASNI